MQQVTRHVHQVAAPAAQSSLTPRALRPLQLHQVLTVAAALRTHNARIAAVRYRKRATGWAAV